MTLCKWGSCWIGGPFSWGYWCTSTFPESKHCNCSFHGKVCIYSIQIMLEKSAVNTGLWRCLFFVCLFVFHRSLCHPYSFCQASTVMSDRKWRVFLREVIPWDTGRLSYMFFMLESPKSVSQVALRHHSKYSSFSLTNYQLVYINTQFRVDQVPLD